MKTCKSPRRVLIAAYELAQLFLPEYSSKFSRKDFTLPQLFACLKKKRGHSEFLPCCPGLSVTNLHGLKPLLRPTSLLRPLPSVLFFVSTFVPFVALRGFTGIAEGLPTGAGVAVLILSGLWGSRRYPGRFGRRRAKFAGKGGVGALKRKPRQGTVTCGAGGGWPSRRRARFLDHAVER
jgi:hypothetical protein